MTCVPYLFAVTETEQSSKENEKGTEHSCWGFFYVSCLNSLLLSWMLICFMLWRCLGRHYRFRFVVKSKSLKIFSKNSIHLNFHIIRFPRSSFIHPPTKPQIVLSTQSQRHSVLKIGQKWIAWWCMQITYWIIFLTWIRWVLHCIYSLCTLSKLYYCSSPVSERPLIIFWKHHHA